MLRFGGRRSFAADAQGGLWCNRQQWHRHMRSVLHQSFPGQGGRTHSQSGAGCLPVSRMARPAGSLVTPTSSLRYSAIYPGWFYKHFSSGSIPVLINHCEGDPSKTQCSLELCDGRSQRERERERERGCRKEGERERFYSNSEREKRYTGRGEQSQWERQTRKLRAGGEPCSTPARPRNREKENPAVIAFSLREGGRLTTDDGVRHAG